MPGQLSPPARGMSKLRVCNSRCSLSGGRTINHYSGHLFKIAGIGSRPPAKSVTSKDRYLTCREDTRCGGCFFCCTEKPASRWAVLSRVDAPCAGAFLAQKRAPALGALAFAGGVHLRLSFSKLVPDCRPTRSHTNPSSMPDVAVLHGNAGVELLDG